MNPEEIIQAKIAEMGHVHEVTADRSVTPVLYTPAAEEGADVWELWLKGTRHPDWQIIHRQLTKEEAEAIRAEVSEGLNPCPDVAPCDFYVRDGRKAGWTRSMVAKPGGPKRSLHPDDLPRRALDPSGALHSFKDSECPYNAAMAPPDPYQRHFEGDPRTHADVVNRLNEQLERLESMPPGDVMSRAAREDPECIAAIGRAVLRK